MRIAKLAAAISAACVLLFASTAGAVWGYYAWKLPSVELIGKADACGHATPVSLNAIPRHVIHAIVAAEDPDFWTRRPITSLRVIGNLIEFAINGDVARTLANAGPSLGGQIASHSLWGESELRQGRSLEHHIRSIIQSDRVELLLTKEAIAEAYLNTAYFGQGACGLREAAATYFAKEPEALKPSESALLAAMLRGPSTYDPYRHPEKAQQRRNLVLHKTMQLGFLSSENLEVALKSPLGVASRP